MSTDGQIATPESTSSLVDEKPSTSFTSTLTTGSDKPVGRGRKRKIEVKTRTHLWQEDENDPGHSPSTRQKIIKAKKSKQERVIKNELLISLKDQVRMLESTCKENPISTEQGQLEFDKIQMSPLELKLVRENEALRTAINFLSQALLPPKEFSDE